MTRWLLKRLRGAPQYDKLDDDALVTLTLTGDHDAFGEIYGRYHAKVAATITRIMGHQAVLEDLVQETFIKAYDALSRFEVGRPFSPWLLQIARNTAWSGLRAQRVTIDLSQVQHLRAIDQWDTLTARERLSAFRAALDRLNDHARETLIMHDIEGLTLAEIAAHHDVSLNTVASRVRRARARVSELMSTGGAPAPARRFKEGT